MSPALVIGAPEHANRFMTRQRAEQLVERGRAYSAAAQAGADGFISVLQEARAGNAHEVLGLRWHDLVELMWGRPLSDLALTNRPERVVERLALVQSLRAVVDGRGKATPMKAIAERLGVTAGIVHRDLNPGGTGKVIDIDPEREPVVELPAPTGTVWEQAHEYLRRQGDRGLTRLELAVEAGWSDGKAGGVLVRLRRKRLAVNSEDRRLDYEVFVYVAPVEAES